MKRWLTNQIWRSLRTRDKGIGAGASRCRRRAGRPALERLEDRTVLTADHFTSVALFFNLQNPGQAFPVVNPAAVIISLTVIVDEDTRPSASGAVIIDNINFNGNYIGKPGNN